MAIVLSRHTDFDQIMVDHPEGYPIILVRIAGQIHAYRNRCPHVGVGLDWGDGRCLSGENELQCAMHGALFEADTGLCFAGPCQGRTLDRIPVRVEAGLVVMDGIDSISPIANAGPGTG